MTSSWFFLSTQNYDARSTTHQIKIYILGDQIKRKKWAEHVARMREKRESCRPLAIRPEPKRLIEKLSKRCEDDTEKSFQTLDRREREVD